MKIFSNYYWLLLLISFTITACSSLPKSQRSQEFIVLKSGDTLKAEKLRAVNPFGNIGTVTLTNTVNGEEVVKKHTYDQIYQIHYVDRKNRKKNCRNH